MSSAQTTLVFVYGTLKTGEYNHKLMKEGSLEKCKPRGKYKTVERFPLVVASRYNTPYLLYAEGKGQRVDGELYEVNEEQLQRMDQLENHPDYYERMDVSVTSVSSESNDPSASTLQTVDAQAYFLVKFRQELLSLPMLESYTDLIDGKKFIGRPDRKPNTPFWYEVHTGYTEEQV